MTLQGKDTGLGLIQGKEDHIQIGLLEIRAIQETAQL